jgi:hypothetical protein
VIAWYERRPSRGWLPNLHALRQTPAKAIITAPVFLGYEPSMECTRCGACCVAPDIAGLDKPLGVRCPHLTAENLCAIYEQRPLVCRSYEPDDLCRRIQAPDLEKRVALYLAEFGLIEEAARVRASGASTMTVARRLPLVR